MESTCDKISKNIQNRIRRIAGQVNGIEKMLQSGRNSIEIVQQISAVKASLSTLAVEILKDESQECMNKKNHLERQKSFEAIIKNLFNIT